MSVTLADLPNEVIFQILLYVPLESTPTLLRVSRRFNEAAQALLWKFHCRTQFRYWSEEHDIKHKFDNARQVDWKSIFAKRHSVDRETRRTLDSIISSQLDRINKSESIVRLGYDAKDTLLRNIHVGEDAEDVLARHFYSRAVLGHLHRTMAIEEWAKLQDGQEIPLERALAAFDMFILREGEGDFDDIGAILDRLAHAVQTDIPELNEKKPREKALAILAYIRANNWTGVTRDESYHDLQNNFIGIALQDPNHPSLPPISVAIFCCVAKRLGVNAHPCSFPFHAIAIVLPPPRLGLAGGAIDDLTHANPMYLDPFRSDDELIVKDLQGQLSAMAIAPSRHATLLGPASTVEMVQRTAGNIINSVHHDDRNDKTETDDAFYAALWALLLLPEAAANTPQSQRLHHFVEYLEKEFFMDIGMVEAKILPRLRIPGQHELIQGTLRTAGQYELIQGTLRVIRAGDSMGRERRTRNSAQEVKYHVGQVFIHRRYNYVGIIIGWDLEGEDWNSRGDFAEMARGRYQRFYRVLVNDSTVRYVAEENIAITQLEQVGQDLMDLAGRYFKRWNRSSGTFVSNIRDEYPDD